jgi:hypothetical protein
MQTRDALLTVAESSAWLRLRVAVVVCQQVMRYPLFLAARLLLAGTAVAVSAHAAPTAA